MSKPDFRALCQELMDAIDSGIPRGRIKQSPLAVRVDAALAQPEPQGPSDAANRIAHYLEQRRLIRGLDPEVINALHAGTDEPRQAALTVSDLEALARYARPAIQPVVPTDEYWDALKERLWDQHQTIGYQGKRFMYYNDFSAAFDDARAVLARWGRSVIEPEPQGLTDAEIDDWHSQCADLTRVGEADHYWAFDFRHDEVAEVVRAALARWGRPATAGEQQ